MELSLGKFTVKVDPYREMRIPSRAVVRLEDEILRLVENKTSSLLVRLDMAPWSGEGMPPIYEVETAPGGLMIWGFVNGWLPKSLVNLVDVAVCTSMDWLAAYKLLSKLTGWPIYTGFDHVPKGKRVYYSGTLANLKNVTLVTDPFTNKEFIVEVTGGLVLDESEMFSFEKAEELFPTGFVVKPADGWGARDVIIWPPKEFRGLPGASTRKKVEEALKAPRRRIIQPFFHPGRMEEMGGRMFYIWRIYALRHSTTRPFKLLGGLWNSRPNLKVHGSSDAIFGLLLLS